MPRLLCCLIISLLAASAFASKDRGVYVGAGVYLVDVGIVDPFQNDVNFKAGEVQIGYKYNGYLGIELRGGTSLNDETIALSDNNGGIDGSASSSIDNYTSIYYRAEVSNEIAKLYLLLGQSSISTTVEFDNGSPDFEASDSGFSYGVGFGMWLDERMNLNFEFKSLVDTSDDSFFSGGISADYRF